MISSLADCISICRLAKALEQNEDIALRLIEFERADTQSENALCQLGLSVENDAVKKITAILEDSDSYTTALVEEAGNQLIGYDDETKQSNHRQRRQYLEDIIRMLQPVEDKAKNASFFTLLARAYLYRGLLYRPKGRTIPARKTEAIRKAMMLADRAINLLSSSKEVKGIQRINIQGTEHESDTSLKREAWRIWSYAALELEKVDTSFKTDKLREAVNFICKNKIDDLNDAIIVLTYMERSSNGKKKNKKDKKVKKFFTELDSFLNDVKEGRKYQKKRADFFLLKAKYLFLSDPSGTSSFEKTKEYLNEAINNAPAAFAAPFWDDLVDFLKKLTWDESKKDFKNDKWKESILSAYEKCKDIENKTTSNIFLRWYWSRQKDLYDLAFLAAGLLEEKEKIADSLKSRPTLLYQALNDLRGQIDGIETILEREDESRDGRYLKNMGYPEKKGEPKRKDSSKSTGSPKKKKNKNKSKGKEFLANSDSEKKERWWSRPIEKFKNLLVKSSLQKKKKKSPLVFERLPEPWIAIHFYLSELKGKGYALIFNSNSENDKWREEKFDYHELHRKFLAWQELYLLLGKETSDSLVKVDKDVSDSLEELCYAIGDTMQFLFDEDVIAKNSRVLWIPHGFLHRLPLHAAICRKNNEVFLENHISRYLPAWHMLETKKIKENSSGGEYLLKDISNRTFNFLEKKIKWSNPDYKTKTATPKFLIDCMKENPSVLAILCHGEGNILNPFKSKLKLGSGISIIDILKSEVVNISGTRVMLGACESDTAPPTEHTIDEHLSLSTVFLLHHAQEVIAGLWKVEAKSVDNCYKSILNGVKEKQTNFSTGLNEWQKKKILEWKSELKSIEKEKANSSTALHEWQEKKNKAKQKFYYYIPFRVMGFPEISEVSSDKE